MAKTKKKKKKFDYTGVFNETTGMIDWTLPVKTSTNPENPPPPKP